MKIKVNFLESDAILKAKFIQSKCCFKAFSEIDEHIDINFGELFFINKGDIYEGIYNVIPRVYPQRLETKEKLMEDNVTVEVIPIAKVINLSNGYTVTIG